MNTNRKKARTISKGDYLKLVGLVTLAESHNDALRDIEQTAQAITKETDFGHTADMIYGSRGVDEGLRLLGIKVRS